MKPCILAATLALFLLAGCERYDYETKASRTIDFSANIASGQTFLVSAPGNHIDVNVTHGSGPGCKGKLTIKATANSRKAAEKSLKDTQVTFKETSTGVNVNVVAAARHMPLVFDVTLPKGAGVELRSETGNVTGNHVDGPFKAVSQTGMVSAEDVSGPISLQSDTGAVGVTYPDDAPRSPKITATSKSGDVHCDDIAGDVSVESQSGDIDVTYWKNAPASPAVKIHTESGDIDFTPPGALDAHVDVSTGSGRISGSLAVSPAPGASAKTIQVTVGSGKGSVTLQTGSGDIDIHEAEGSGDEESSAPLDSSTAI